MNNIAWIGIAIFSAILAGYVMAIHQGQINPLEFSVLQWVSAISSFLTTIAQFTFWKLLKQNQKKISAIIKISDFRIQFFIVLLTPPMFVIMTWLQDNLPRIVQGELSVSIELQQLFSYLFMAGFYGWISMPTMLLFALGIFYIWERTYERSVSQTMLKN